MGKMKDALVKLARKVTGKEVKDENSISNVVNFMADNYEGGGSGGASLYVHKLWVECLDGCDEAKGYEIKLLSSSNQAITIDTFKDIFNFVGGEEGTTDPHMALNIIQCLYFDESDNTSYLGEMLYYESDDRLQFTSYQTNNYSVSSLTVTSVEDEVSPAI